MTRLTDALEPLRVFKMCADCGKPIERFGDRWAHMTTPPQEHPARPFVSKDGELPADPAIDETGPAADWTPNAKVMREELAAYAHDAWAGWMRWMFQFCTEAPGGGLTIPPEKVARWTRQMVTPYDRLPESERASDIAEAEKMMAILFKHGYRISED